MVLADGTVEDLPETTQTIGQNGVLIVVCHDANGQEVRVYDRLAVVLFSHNDEVKRIAEGMRFERSGFAAVFLATLNGRQSSSETSMSGSCLGFSRPSARARGPENGGICSHMG